MKVTAVAPTNIAILKYWGKHPLWEKYHIPMKSSLSFTVDGLYTKTTVEVEKGSGKVSFTLNGREITPDMKEYEYVEDFFGKIGRLFPFVKNYDYKIVSENNFPTAAGFASSASGFAALVKAIVGAVEEFSPYRDDDRKLSALARLGSGSASRSIPREGGFVGWWRGFGPHFLKEPEAYSEEERWNIIFSSYAETLYGPDHWPELRIIYVKVKKKEKKVKSRAGMRQTVKDHPLYKDWIDYEEGQMKDTMIRLVREKRFPQLAELIMRASNNLHAMALSTYRPIIYMNETSHAIIDAIHDLNLEKGENVAAYTFDAGPNAVVFTLSQHENEVLSLLREIVGGENVFATKPGRGPYYTEEHLF